MAEQWIKMRTSLPKHPKVIAMAVRLSTDEYFIEWWVTGTRQTCNECVTDLVTFDALKLVVVGGLLAVWGLANELSDDGVLRYATLFELDELAGIPSFGDAMAGVGWAVEDTGKRTVTLPNFHDWNVPRANRQPMSGAERARKCRDRKRNESVTPRDVTFVTGVTGRDGVADRTTGVTKRNARNDRLDKRREDKKEEKNPPTPQGVAVTPPFDPAGVSMPPGLDTLAFLDAWGAWCRYRAESKKKLTATGVERLLKKLMKLGEVRAVAAIDHSIAQGWTGVYEDKDGGRPAKGQTFFDGLKQFATEGQDGDQG